jgi:hypothetical protein
VKVFLNDQVTSLMNLVGLIQVKVMIRDRDSLTRILIDSY